MKQVKQFAEEVKEKLPTLDCLINNAAIFDKEGPHKSADGFEMTFQVNVLAPFILTIILGTSLKPERIINTSSMSHTDSKHHLNKLDYENLQHEKGFSAYSSYGLSKLLVNMFTRGLKSKCSDLKDITLINMDPGTVNTKMLEAGWGMCGIPVEEADDTYQLATKDKYLNTKEVVYYEHLKPSPQAKQVYDNEACQKLVNYLLQKTKLEIQ
jgi:NAD(P)-dependent dehydrogenase (short-subunit alcohol dehydrogenase family)